MLFFSSFLGQNKIGTLISYGPLYTIRPGPRNREQEGEIKATGKARMKGTTANSLNYDVYALQFQTGN